MSKWISLDFQKDAVPKEGQASIYQYERREQEGRMEEGERERVGESGREREEGERE